MIEGTVSTPEMEEEALLRAIGNQQLAESERAGLLELDERMKSRWWRISNLYWIEGEDEEGNRVVMRFKPNWAQKLFYTTMHWLCEILKVRQLGISTFIAIFGLDDVLFNLNHKFGIIDKTATDAKKKLQKCKFAYDNLNRPDPENPDLVALGASVKAARPLIAPTNSEVMTFGGEAKGAIWAGTSFRGDTAQVLHISELGYIAHYFPKKAEEIMGGSTNAVHRGNHIFVESTYDGPPLGEFYDLIQLALANQDKDLEEMTEMDWRHYFLTWFKHPEYQLRGAPVPDLTEHEQRYYDKLEKHHGIFLSDARKAWHVRKWRALGPKMMREFPSTVEDCLNSAIKGAIYSDNCVRAKEDGRISKINVDNRYPVYAFWDLGFSDFMAIWLVQFVGAEIRLLRYNENTRKKLSYYAQWLDEFCEANECRIQAHYLPHDANTHSLAGKTFAESMAEHGFHNVVVVPRTPDVWVGIDAVRELFGNFHFDESTLYRWQDEERGKNYVGGFHSLEAYSCPEETAAGIIKTLPVHNQASHGADGLRTLAEAYTRNMIVQGVAGAPKTQKEKKVPKVKNTAGQHHPGRTKSRKPKVKR